MLRVRVMGVTLVIGDKLTVLRATTSSGYTVF
jgi:hypothetical protein